MSMVTELLVPRPRLIVPKLPSYVKLDMAFGVKAGTTLYDKSRYRSHGAITGCTWQTGLHGGALNFIHTTPSYIEIPASATQLNFTSEDFSIIARIYLDTLTDSRSLLNHFNGSTRGYLARIDSNGSIVFYTFQATGSQVSYTWPGDFATDAWYTVGISRDGASIKFYKNGVNIVRVEGNHIDPASYVSTTLIGIRENKTTHPLDGWMEFFRVFGGIALPASTHLAYHNALA